MRQQEHGINADSLTPSTDPGIRKAGRSILKVLIAEDLSSDAELILREMGKLEAEIVHEVVETRETFLEAMDEFDPDIVLSDYSMPVFDGMTALKLLQERKPDIPFIIVTGSQNEEIAVECMKAGAADYMIKENLRRLVPAVMASLEKCRLKRENMEAMEAVRKSRDELENLVKERTAELQDKNTKLNEEISERRKAEEEKNKVEAQLVQAQKIEALGRFAGGIAHDLNNILYPIIINTEMLLEEADAGTSQYDALEQTLHAAYRQRDLVKQILSFSRQGDPVFKLIRVGPLLEETLHFARSFLPSTIEIRQHIDGSADTVMGNPVKIQQVIMNIFKNAADALESEQGSIEVSLTSRFQESFPPHLEMQAGNYVELKIADTGYGMTPEQIDRIFEPFYTTKSNGKGSGMGLPVVHGILKSHGGTVTVASEPCKGSVFTVYLPLFDGHTVTESPEKESSEESQKRILLVDDEEIILSSMKRALEKSGYAVFAVKDGQEALDLFDKDPEAFDLVITDLTMPGMTGTTLAKRVKKIRSDIRVILCTGFSDVINEKEARAQGIWELILKPSSTSELKTAIRRAMES